MKLAIVVLTFLLVLCGLFIVLWSLYATGIGFYTPILTFLTLVGLGIILFDKKNGETVLLVASIGWLLRYFEHASYLILYDPSSSGRWELTITPLGLAFSIFGLTLREKFKETDRSFKFWYVPFSLVIFLSIGLFSFIYKPHTSEFNCSYSFDNVDNRCKIVFAVSPDYIFEATTNSKELKQIVLSDGVIYEGHEGSYYMKTKVQVITRFKKVIGLKILGFTNTEYGKMIKSSSPIEIDLGTIIGDKSLLQPDFSWGD